MSSKQNDDLQKVAVVWIIACNDESPIITIKSILDRVGFVNEEEAYELIKRHRELFRLGASESRLNTFKSKLINTPLDRLPSWLKPMRETERQTAINSLTTENVFRSQLRIAYDAPPATIETLSWGLEYIEQIRKSKAEKHGRKYTYLNLVVTVLSLLLALFSVYFTSQYNNATILEQNKARETEKHLRMLEITFKSKQEAYALLMSSLESAFINAQSRKDSLLQKDGKVVSTQLLVLQPFLSPRANSNIQHVWKECIRNLTLVARGQESSNYKGKALDDTLNKYSNYFSQSLYPPLFDVDSMYSVYSN